MATYREKRSEFVSLTGVYLFMLTLADTLEKDASPASVARAINSLRARGIDLRESADETLQQISDMTRS